MGLTRITPPTSTPVSLVDAKQHLRVSSADEDFLIESYVKAATQHLDGRDGALGRCLLTQTWQLKLDRFQDPITVPLPPCQSVTSIQYVDVDGNTQTLAASEYHVARMDDAAPAIIRPAYGKTWPSTRPIPESVIVTFVAGFGDDPADVPETIRTAILEHVGTLFENRESTIVGLSAIEEFPGGAQDLVLEHKAWMF